MVTMILFSVCVSWEGKDYKSNVSKQDNLIANSQFFILLPNPDSKGFFKGMSKLSLYIAARLSDFPVLCNNFYMPLPVAAAPVRLLF